MSVTPIADLGRRLPQGGRIRTGVKGPNGYPERLKTFRFTSADEKAIHQIRDLYGGQVTEWDSKAGDRFQVISGASEISIALPPDPLSGTPIYEQCSGGGIERRCDGAACEITEAGPDGGERVSVPCLCDRQRVLLCKPKTRLSVILPDIRFNGVWRYESGSWDVAREMPGFVDMIGALQARGITTAKLRLEERIRKSRDKNGKPKTFRFMIPVLALDATPEQIASGGAALGQRLPELPTGATAIGSGEVTDLTWERLTVGCRAIGADSARALAAALEIPSMVRKDLTETVALRLAEAVEEAFRFGEQEGEVLESTIVEDY